MIGNAMLIALGAAVVLFAGAGLALFIYYAIKDRHAGRIIFGGVVAWGYVAGILGMLGI